MGRRGKETSYDIRITISAAVSSKSEKAFFKHRLVIQAKKVNSEQNTLSPLESKSQVEFSFSGTDVYNVIVFIALIPG